MEKDWDSSAEDYYSDVISPLKNSTHNPLFEDIKKYSSKSNTAGDLGCGIGELEPTLSKLFKTVYAWDYSKKMIEQCEKNSKQLENVECKLKDLTKITERNLFDVAISVNSILEPNTKKVDKMFHNIYRATKHHGIFLGVLPAIESYIYQAMLQAESANDSTPLPKIKKQLLQEIDFVKGTVKFDEGTQKAFYRFEIMHRMKKAGFKNIEIKKVHYSWKAWQAAGQQYFPTESPPWDWYVKANK